MEIEQLRNIAGPLCTEFGVQRLEAFGSITRGTFTPSSDVDLLVEFKQPEDRPAMRFFGLLHRLEDVLGCKVDLLTVAGLRNPYFRSRVAKEKVAIYEG